MIIYHGSTNVIKKPELNKGKPYNDFGKGFYCTEEIEKAKEWACKDNIDGILNCYDLDISKLKILNLTLEKYNILNWISVLIHNRVFHVQNPISINGKKFLEDNYIKMVGY